MLCWQQKLSIILYETDHLAIIEFGLPRPFVYESKDDEYKDKTLTPVLPQSSVQ